MRDREGRLRQSVEGLEQKRQTNLRNERNEQGQDNKQEVSQFCDELEGFFGQTHPSFPRQYDLRFPG